MKRHVVPAFLDFDYRANSMGMVINESWDEKVKAQHRENRARDTELLAREFGQTGIEQKAADFIVTSPHGVVRA
jgi:hypothetical protein